MKRRDLEHIIGAAATIADVATLRQRLAATSDEPELHDVVTQRIAAWCEADGVAG